MVIANPPLAEPVIDPGGVTIKPPFEMGVANLPEYMALILRNGGSQSPDRWLKEPRNNHVVNCIVSFICTTRLSLFRLCISLKKLCRTVVYIISNICSHNISFAENELFLQKTE